MDSHEEPLRDPPPCRAEFLDRARSGATDWRGSARRARRGEDPLFCCTRQRPFPRRMMTKIFHFAMCSVHARAALDPLMKSFDLESPLYLHSQPPFRSSENNNLKRKKILQ